MTDAASTWKRLRLKTDPTAADLDWAGTITTPNRLTALVGGTATAGVYSLQLVGKVFTRTGQIDVDFTATITRVGETSGQIATDLGGDFTLGTVTTASPVLLSSLGITASVDTATVTILFPPNANITVTAVAPAPGTITMALGTVVPISASAPHYARGGESSMNGVVVMVNAMDDAAGTILLAPGTGTQTTFDLQGVEICEVETVDARGDRTYTTRYGRTTTLTGCTLGNEYQIPLRGAKYWTVRVASIPADAVASTGSYEIVYRDAAT